MRLLDSGRYGKSGEVCTGEAPNYSVCDNAREILEIKIFSKQRIKSPLSSIAKSCKRIGQAQKIGLKGFGSNSITCEAYLGSGRFCRIKGSHGCHKDLAALGTSCGEGKVLAGMVLDERPSGGGMKLLAPMTYISLL